MWFPFASLPLLKLTRDIEVSEPSLSVVNAGSLTVVKNSLTVLMMTLSKWKRFKNQFESTLELCKLKGEVEKKR